MKFNAMNSLISTIIQVSGFWIDIPCRWIGHSNKRFLYIENLKSVTNKSLYKHPLGRGAYIEVLIKKSTVGVYIINVDRCSAFTIVVNEVSKQFLRGVVIRKNLQNFKMYTPNWSPRYPPKF